LDKAFFRYCRCFRPSNQALIDGEVVVVHEGRTNFSELQAELAGDRQDRLLFYAFDLLWRDGQDLRKTSQLARKELLKEYSRRTE
jgi:bifunctional non-homologous end joining protein LigD